VLVLLGISNVLMGMAGNAVVPILLGLLWIAYVIASPKLSIRKQLKTFPHVTEEGIYEFDEAHFTIARPSVQVSASWTIIHSVVEMKDLFAIFTTKTCFYSIPKRFFPAEELSSFRDLLKEALQKNGKQLISREPRS
jgi:hypothetical protein